MNTLKTLGVLGFDFGGTVRQDYDIADGSELSILNPDPQATGYLTTKSFRGARPSLQRLRWHFTRAICVSRVDIPEPRVLDRIRRWYAVKGFGHVLKPEDVYICLKRSDKAAICRQHGVTYFIDNRSEVLSSLVGIVPNLYLFEPQPGGCIKHWRGIVIVCSWRQFEWHILHTAGRI